jgi:WD40 repeat protein
MLPELEVSGNPVIALGLTSGGAGALSISSDRTLRVWDTTQPKAVRTLEFNKEQRPVGAPILQVFPGFAAISQDKNQFASPRLIPRTAGTLPDYVPFVIDIRTGAPVFSGEIVDSGTMTQVGLTPDASRLAALSRSSQGGIIQLMDVPSGKLLETWTITDNMPKNGPIALSPDGNRVAVAVDAMTPSGPDHLNSKILVFKIGSPKALLAIDGPKDTAAGQPVFLPDGKRLAFIAGNNAHIWNLHTHRGSAILKGHHNSIGAIVSSPDGSRIVTGGSDGTVRIWDGNRYEHMFTLRTSRDEGIQSLAVSSDGMCIAAGTTSGRIYLWNASQPGEL